MKEFFPQILDEGHCAWVLETSKRLHCLHLQDRIISNSQSHKMGLMEVLDHLQGNMGVVVVASILHL